MEKQYRKCAGIVVFNSAKKVLMCARADNKKSEWQFPQGGIETNETSIEAAKRELFEETSITSVRLITYLEDPIRYDFPKKIRERFFSRKIYNSGQDMYWCLFEFVGEDSEINLQTETPEFKAYEWVDIDEAPKKVISFKKDNYRQMIKAFKPFIN